MALDVSSIQASSLQREGGMRATAPEGEDLAQATLPGPRPAIRMQDDLQSVISDLKKVSEAFNRRLSFSLNEKLGQVVVKVIDNDTDKVVREIPPVELQHVYERIREVIGLLFDKSA